METKNADKALSIAKLIFIVLIGIAINVLGRYIALRLSLPIWLDMTGTIISSYYTSLWGGIAVAVISSVVSTIFDSSAIAYCLTAIAAAILIHIFIRKTKMSALRAYVCSFWLGLVCTVVSTPVNIIFYDGYTGNIWGDTLFDMLDWYEAPFILCALAADGFVEIVDKQICVLLACLVIMLIVSRKRLFAKRLNEVASVAVALLVGIHAFSVPASALEDNLFENNYVHTIYNNTNGMVSSEANVIGETDDGHIWIGSYSGLSRFDGAEFVRDGSFINVTDLMTDSQGRLWIGTNDAGIARYENGTYTYFTEEDGLPSMSIRCFAEDENGNVYVGTSNTICKFSPDDTIEELSVDIAYAKKMVAIGSKLVVIDNTGYIHLTDGTTLFETSPMLSEDIFLTIENTSRGILAGTDTGELLIISIEGDYLEFEKSLFSYYSSVLAVEESSDQNLWVATNTQIDMIDREENHHPFFFESFASAYTDIHEDYQGNIWISSERYGVMLLSKTDFVNVNDKIYALPNVTNAVIVYDNHLFFGTDTELNFADHEDNINYSAKYDNLYFACSNTRVRDLFEDSQGRLWVCTYDGLFCVENGEFVTLTTENGATSNRFRCIEELSDGTFITGTADGINFISELEIVNTLTADDGLGNTQILSLCEGDNGLIYAGSDGSGIYVIKDGKLIDTLTREDGLSSDVILKIVKCDKGYFIVTSNALCFMNNQGETDRIDSFPYYNNYDVIICGDMAFVTCSAGIYKISVSELSEDRCENIRLYSASDGLFSGLTANSRNYVTKNGEIYLASNNGVVAFAGVNSQESDNSDIKFGIVSCKFDDTEVTVSGSEAISFEQDVDNIAVYASVRNYYSDDLKTKFYIKGDDSPELYDWDAIEPIIIQKADSTNYVVILEVYDNSGSKLIASKQYNINTGIHPWETITFKTYLALVCIEISIFLIITIVSMVVFVTRKNELEKQKVELDEQVNEQTQTIRQSQQQLSDMFIQTVTALAEAVDAKDRYTSGHSLRVAQYSKMLAQRMGLSEKEQDDIYKAGLLHDVGKIRIPVEIINKNGRLTDEEYDIIKIHPVTGYHILRGIDSSSIIAQAAKYHHERYDGKGYPNGIEGENIPLAARILGVADSYDAMTSNRSYRNALPQEVVRNEILKGRGTQFDPQIADLMIEFIDNDTTYQLKQNDNLNRTILAIDDEPINHKIIGHIMKDEPMYKMLSAYSGQQALEILSQNHIDLILLDVNMPGMNGLETLRAIRRKYNTPVVLLTGDKNLDITDEFEALGCDDYITKPFLPLLIKEVIHNMTERINLN